MHAMKLATTIGVVISRTAHWKSASCSAAAAAAAAAASGSVGTASLGMASVDMVAGDGREGRRRRKRRRAGEESEQQAAGERRGRSRAVRDGPAKRFGQGPFRLRSRAHSAHRGALSRESARARRGASTRLSERAVNRHPLSTRRAPCGDLESRLERAWSNKHDGRRAFVGLSRKGRRGGAG